MKFNFIFFSTFWVIKIGLVIIIAITTLTIYATHSEKFLFLLILIISFVWLVVPFTMAVLWSLVDPSEPWTADKIFPPVMSFYRWDYMWENSNLKENKLIIPFLFLFFVEIFPIKTTGSFFTTGNATFIFLLMAITVGLSRKQNLIES